MLFLQLCFYLSTQQAIVTVAVNVASSVAATKLVPLEFTQRNTLNNWVAP